MFTVMDYYECVNLKNHLYGHLNKVDNKSCVVPPNMRRAEVNMSITLTSYADQLKLSLCTLIYEDLESYPAFVSSVLETG